MTTAVASRLLGFSPRAARTANAFAGGYSALAATTDYRLAVWRLVPFRTHGAVDAVLGFALPWLLGFSRDRRARNFFLGLAAVSMAVTALTQWTNETDDKVRRRE